MSKQNAHKAGILLGSRNTSPFSEFSIPIYWDSSNSENTYSLIIDGKFLSSATNFKPDEIAVNYANIMKMYGVAKYSLVNGERIEFYCKERIKVFKMPKEDVNTFKKTLEARLKERK